VSKKNELQVWNYIDKLCNEILERYETTIEEDDKILAEDDANGNKLGLNKRNCVLFRKGEKAILVYMIDMAAKVRKFMTMSSKDVKKEVNKWQGNEDCYLYVKGVICALLDQPVE
jgi:hypothetical protein